MFTFTIGAVVVRSGEEKQKHVPESKVSEGEANNFPSIPELGRRGDDDLGEIEV